MDDQKHLIKKLDSFFAPFKERQSQPGEILVRAGSNPTGIFYLTDGIVKQYAITQKGDEVILNLYHHFAFFPMSWAINGTPNSYYFEAMTPVRTRQAPPATFLEFLKNEPDILYDLISRVFRGLDGLNLRLSFLLAGNTYACLITELLITAKRFGQAINQGTSLQVTVNQKDIAAQSGMTRETVGREMSILKEKGLISFDHHILTIHDTSRLEKELYQSS